MKVLCQEDKSQNSVLVKNELCLCKDLCMKMLFIVRSRDSKTGRFLFTLCLGQIYEYLPSLFNIIVIDEYIIY